MAMKQLANQSRVIQRRNQLNANQSKPHLWRLVALLDLRFTDPDIESRYHCYYAQVKRDLLPTAIQVVLLVNLLQFLMTLFNYYLISGQDFALGSLLSSSSSSSSTSSNVQLSQSSSSFNLSNQNLGHQQHGQNGPNSLLDGTEGARSNNTHHHHNYYSSTLWFPILIQLLIFIQTFYLLKCIRRELSPHHRRQSSICDETTVSALAEQNQNKPKHRKQQSAEERLSASLSLAIATHDSDSDSNSCSSASSSSSSNNSDELEQELSLHHQHKANERGEFEEEAIKLKKKKKTNNKGTKIKCGRGRRRRRRSLSSNAQFAKCQQVSCFRLAMPYILWLLQLIQIACALWPQQSFIAYSTLLLYSYAIYVILPIRLPSCILLACSMCLLEPTLDWLLLLKLKHYFFNNNYGSNIAPLLFATSDVFNMTSEAMPQHQRARQQQPARQHPHNEAFTNATGNLLVASQHAPNSNAIIASVLTIPMTSQLNKLWAFILLALGVNIIGIMSFFFYDRQQRSAFIETRQNFSTKVTLEQESREQERLLLSILPKHLAAEIRQDLGAVLTGQFKKIYMRRHENVSILFADIVGFTAISSHCPAPELVKTLNELFARFDKLAEKYHQLRIKILGDCYYAISGAPKERSDHAVLCVHMGLSMVEAIKSVRERTKSTVDMRVGVHTGGVLAGVLGQRQWQFDVYSKDVELANKMESSGLPGRVHISNATLRFLNDEFEVCDGDGASREEALRLANIKTYFIVRVKKPYPEGTLDAPILEQHLQNEAGERVSGSSMGRENVVITINPQQQQQTKTTTGTEQPNKDAKKERKRTRRIRAKRQQHGGSVVETEEGGQHQNQRREVERKDTGSEEKKQRNDSFELDNEIKRVSLNFCNSQFEKQFRSTSDITSCVSLVGLPITLICAFIALLYLYELPLYVTVTYNLNSIILMTAVAICVLPYLWRRQKQQWLRVMQVHQQHQQHGERVSSSLASSAPPSEFGGAPGSEQYLANCILRASHAVGQSAWMKLVLSALMTLLWLAAHLLACIKLIEQFSRYLPVSPRSISFDDLLQQSLQQSNHESGLLSTKEQEELLFSVDLLNYFSVTCALAITAITRISFLVKTLIILVVILQQVILNKTILANLLMLRSTFMLVLPQAGLEQFYPSTSSNSSDQFLIFKNQTFRDTSPEQRQHYQRNIKSTYGLDPNTIELGKSLAEFDQYVFTVTLVAICLALYLMNRQFELTNRRMFLYRKQAEERKEKVADMRRKNEMLVYNILPPNVAKIFLGKRQLNDEELYSKSYEAVGVLFAAMPNFSDFYSEESVNNQGLECLRFLNEVISDYDALLDQNRFKNIIKIKTMGSTYMAASGLYEGDALSASTDHQHSPALVSDDQSMKQTNEEQQQHQQQPGDEIKTKWGHLEQLTEFALALKDTLNNINRESFNNFVLRIGINQGPITAGVIGVKKPHFDMWGNTVNVASRMESTGRAGSIQVVEETATILRHFGFEFDQRGLVSVKGKGKLMTFYLTGRNANKIGSSAASLSGGSGSSLMTNKLEQPSGHSGAMTTATSAAAAAVATTSTTTTATGGNNNGTSVKQQSSAIQQTAGGNTDTSDRRMFITPPSGQRANFTNDASDIHLV